MRVSCTVSLYSEGRYGTVPCHGIARCLEPQRADEQEQSRGEMEMGTGPSVLLAMSQRNMWVKKKIMHARRLARC